MKIYDKVRGEKLKHDINRKVAKVSALSSGKIDKYKYLTRKEVLPSDQESLWMTNKNQEIKQIETLKQEEKQRPKINWRSFSTRSEN